MTITASEGITLTGSALSIHRSIGGLGGTYSVTFVNKGTVPGEISLSINTTIALGATRVLINDEPIQVNESISFTGIIINDDDYLVGLSNLGASINAVAYGLDL